MDLNMGMCVLVCVCVCACVTECVGVFVYTDGCVMTRACVSADFWSPV